MPIQDRTVADTVPWSEEITPYDATHMTIYMRILDADRDGADWREVARIVMQRDPEADPDGTYQCWQDHLKRAEWMTMTGYRRLLAGERELRQ